MKYVEINLMKNWLNPFRIDGCAILIIFWPGMTLANLESVAKG